MTEVDPGITGTAQLITVWMEDARASTLKAAIYIFVAVLIFLLVSFRDQWYTQGMYSELQMNADGKPRPWAIIAFCALVFLRLNDTLFKNVHWHPGWRGAKKRTSGGPHIGVASGVLVK